MPEPTTASRPAPKLFRVGTLVYTRGALAQVMFWMLWGDFFFTVMEALVPTVVPLQLRWEGGSNALIGAVSSSLPAAIGIVLGPIVSVQSDRHRGRLGRRRPFLIWGVPPLVISLVLMGAAKPLGALLNHGFARLGGGGHSAPLFAILCIACCTVGYGVFNVYVQQIYQYLFADVIPAETMGRFAGLYRAVGAFGGFAFSRWVIGWAEVRTMEIYALAALFFGIAFLLLIWRVKEGEYPPPEREPRRGLGVVRTYFRECFTHRFYWTIYCVPLFYWGATVPFVTFIVFFSTAAGKSGYAPTLGLSLMEFGDVKSWSYLIQIPVFFIIGPLIDWFHPVRVAMAGLLLTTLGYFGSFLFINDGATLQIWLAAVQAANAIEIGAYLALIPRLLPREKYGQYCSAMQTVGFAGVVLSPVLSALLIDAVHDYRYIFIWCGGCATIALIASAALWRQWKRLGGDARYAPPKIAPA